MSQWIDKAQCHWAMAVHALGWNNTPSCDHSHCLWTSTMDLVAYLQLTNAVAIEQWIGLDPVIFIIRPNPNGIFQRKNICNTNHLIVGEFFPIKGPLNGLEMCSERSSLYQRILKETHPVPTPAYGDNGGLSSDLSIVESRVGVITPDTEPKDITDWYKEQIRLFGGNLDKENPQNNISSWFNRIYDSERSHPRLWGVADLLEAYCGYRFGTKSMPRQVACYPNIQFYERDFSEVSQDTAAYEWIRGKNANGDLSLRPVVSAPNKGDDESGELV